MRIANWRGRDSIWLMRPSANDAASRAICTINARRSARLLLIADRLPGRCRRRAGTAGGGEQASANVDAVAFDPTVFRREIELVSNEIRRICEDLSPSVLDNVGLRRRSNGRWGMR